MTIIDKKNELRELIAEYSAIRIQELDRLFPNTSINKIESMLNDWKEESLQMLEDVEKCLNKTFPYKIKYNIYQDLGSYWHIIYTDPYILRRRLKDNPELFKQKKPNIVTEVHIKTRGLNKKTTSSVKDLISSFEGFTDRIILSIDSTPSASIDS